MGYGNSKKVLLRQHPKYPDTITCYFNFLNFFDNFKFVQVTGQQAWANYSIEKINLKWLEFGLVFFVQIGHRDSI